MKLKMKMKMKIKMKKKTREEIMKQPQQSEFVAHQWR